jgi:Legume-like lectin family
VHFQLQPTHYLAFPLTKKDFQHWETRGAAVILRNHTVLNPEAMDKKGQLYTKIPSPLVSDWMLDIELNIGNEKKSSRGGAGVGIYYLKSVDSREQHKEGIFGYANRFEGLGVYLNSVLKAEKKGSSNREIMNGIQGYFNDGTSSVNVFGEKKNLCYKKFRNLPPGQNFHLRI